jgi:hypothetical protein
METLLMGFGARNDLKRLAMLAPASTRDGFEAVLPPNPIKSTSIYEFTA